MIFLTLALAVALLVSNVVWGNFLRTLLRGHVRERDQLIDKLCHLAGNPWTPPPAEAYEPPVEPTLPALVFSPEQLPDDEY